MTAKLSTTFSRLTDRREEDRARVYSETLFVQGRFLFVPKAARGGVVFPFKRIWVNLLGLVD